MQFGAPPPTAFGASERFFPKSEGSRRAAMRSAAGVGPRTDDGAVDPIEISAMSADKSALSNACAN